MAWHVHFSLLAKCFALLLVLASMPVLAAEPHSLGAYEAGINRSCQTDADCVVKDVHNCCGYYPACVNRDAKTDPALVQKLCEAAQMGGICGFPEISGCRCANNLCAEAAGNGSPANPVEK